MYYSIDAECSNCSFSGKIEIKKGILVEDSLPRTKCPTCGCKTLGKKVVSVIPRRIEPIPLDIPPYYPKKKKFPNPDVVWCEKKHRYGTGLKIQANKQLMVLN